MRVGWLFLGLMLLGMGCSQPAAVVENRGGFSLTTTPLTAANSCAGHFITHELDHTTTVPGGDSVRMFAANGSGVALNDLDGDGRLDILLANHAGPNTILWNEGDLRFQPAALGEGDARAATIVDVNGDSLLDIVLSRRISAPNYWQNQGERSFRQEFLPVVAEPLYALGWADLDGDLDLDFVGATYDAALLTEYGQEFLSSDEAGVYIYENEAGTFRPTRLADQAQALALLLHDVNADGRLDILVGNDFGVPDYLWLRQGDSWVKTSPFAAISHSTMSFDAGDINNDGRSELFATDMKPYAADPDTMAAWGPIMESMMADPHPEGDPQIMANVLQVRAGESLFTNEAGARGLEATGWSWSSKFGDLDQDGFLDLYVVNGFREETTFAHLPQHELVEENQALRNSGHGRFEPVPAWGLGSTAGGRGMSLADLDNDGDLDIVVNNLGQPAQLFENQLCTGSSLQVALRWPDSPNTHALGSTVTLTTSDGTYRREMRAVSGYLSGDPARLHFGFPAEAQLKQLEVRWPDGQISHIPTPASGSLLTIERHD